MQFKEAAIRGVLEDLQRLEDIHACMVARKNLEGIVPLNEEFKKEIAAVWDIMKNTMDDFFDVIAKYGEYGLNKVNFELGDFDVMFFILPGTDTALVAIVPTLANRGLLEVEMENARRGIIQILEQG